MNAAQSPGQSKRLAINENPRRLDRGGGRMPRQDELPIRPQPTWFFRVVKVATWVASHAAFSVRTTGRRELKSYLKTLPKGTPVIYVANHLSGVDGMLLGSLIPTRPRIHVLAAGESLTRDPVKWWIIKRMGGVFPVDRSAEPGKAVDFDAVYDALRRPEPINLLIFPEGRCGPVEGQLNHEPRTGAVKFAMNTGAVEIPIGITGTSRLWWRRRVRVNFGPPVEYPAGMDDAHARLAIQTRDIERLIEPYHAAFGRKTGQWLFPQTRRERARLRAERDAAREGWNTERLVPLFYRDDADVVADASDPAVAPALTDASKSDGLRAFERTKLLWRRYQLVSAAQARYSPEYCA